mmetsp:Transcript_279/g.518  ORF Transcript_279/g.518 Transcript_279/m.518 type:complete len:168 (+) Transcript_279:147-650(+)
MNKKQQRNTMRRMKPSKALHLLICLYLSATAASFSVENQSSPSDNKRVAASEKSFIAARSAVLSGALLIGLGVPAASAGDIIRGQQIFQINCAVCHAQGRNVIMPEKTLEKEALEKYLYSGYTEEAVVRQVTNGKNAMPAFGGRLGDIDIENVASYVIDMAEAGWEK